MSSLYTVHIREVPEHIIGGPFAIAVVRNADGRTVSSCTGVQSRRRAESLAQDYAWSNAYTDEIGFHRPAPVVGRVMSYETI